MLKTVSIGIDIYIIDNNSKDKAHIEILDDLDLLHNVEVIRNRKNHWVLGLNKTISNIKRKKKIMTIVKQPYFK